MTAAYIRQFLRHRSVCAVFSCGHSRASGAPRHGDRCGHLKEFDVHYVGTPDSHAFVRQPCDCGRDAVIAQIDGYIAQAEALIGLAAWLRTPGNINHDDAIDECARAVENLARRGVAP